MFEQLHLFALAKDSPMLLPVNDSCPRCNKPVWLATIERDSSKPDLALYSIARIVVP